MSNKIILLVFPFWGHINPFSSLASELVKNENTKVIFFGNKEHKAIIESTGSEFRLYSYFPAAEFMVDVLKNRNEDIVPVLLGQNYINITSRILMELVNMIDEEKPDLIIYDSLAVHAKYLIEYLNNRHQSNKSKYEPAPPSFMFSTTFPIVEKLFPNEIESKIVSSVKVSYKTILKALYHTFFAFVRQAFFAWRFGFSNYNPLSIIFDNKKCEINIVNIFPEFQPRHHLFHKSVKFVGCTISEQVRNSEKIEDESLLSILDRFKPINPLLPLDDGYYLSEERVKSNTKLIYVSLGTVVNNNISVYSKMIDALKNLDKEDQILLDKINFKSVQYVCVISCGSAIYEVLQEKIRKNLLQLPENISIFKSVPQIEILKRASLFLTHAGMNSANEAIYYGVPVVCLPLNFDQPTVAYRMSDELGLGIRLETSRVTWQQIRRAVCEVLADKSYQERILRLSQISRRYNGNKNAAKIVFEFIDSKRKKSN